MRALAELRDPWSALVALAAGATVVWFAPWQVAVAVVVAVLAVRMAAGLFLQAPVGARSPSAVPAAIEELDRGPGGKLTPKELEVAALVAEHLTNKQIASRLFVEEKTVETHMEHIFNKLDVHRRSEVAEWWRKRQARVSTAK
jgi:DNA-binding NarL/FixJ family response regulator